MPFYSDELIEEVRSRNPIVDVIGSYVHLQKKGGNYFGLCPFHNEKTPSFSVSATRQMYHCFGCGVGGNVITFVMDYENYSFVEAMEFLADRAGIELPKQEFTKEMKEAADARQTALQMNKDAAVFYVHQLHQEVGKAGLKYFKERRKLTDETIRSFGLGYASMYRDGLYRYLKQKGYTDEQMQDSGLCKIGERGAYDVFFNRVMFPIMDINNRVIGFGGRVMGDGEPKYLNTKETKIFDKSRNLYGLNVARKSREKFLLVCEGYMDVISMHQAGFTNAVASLGTAFTAQHGMLLKRYTDEIILCYDSDGAGRNAALRAIAMLKESGLRIRVLDLSPYKDPDEFIKELGADEFRERIRNAENAFLFELACLRKEYDFQDPGEKARFFNETAKRLASFDDIIERDSYTQTAANVYGIEYALLKAKVSEIGNRVGLTKKDDAVRPVQTGASQLPSKKNRESGGQEAEKLVLTYLLDAPEAYRKVAKLLQPEDFKDELVQQAAAVLFEQLAAGKADPARIIDRFVQTDRYAEVTALLSSGYLKDQDEDVRKQAFREAVLRVKSDALDRRIDKTTDPSQLMDLLREKQDLKRIEVI
ncbi:MAG: DNA primase [Lachnospiraceae bacterium]|nr:DNA primase [Lachnospiraceae bacterium]